MILVTCTEFKQAAIFDALTLIHLCWTIKWSLGKRKILFHHSKTIKFMSKLLG